MGGEVWPSITRGNHGGGVWSSFTRLWLSLTKGNNGWRSVAYSLTKKSWGRGAELNHGGGVWSSLTGRNHGEMGSG